MSPPYISRQVRSLIDQDREPVVPGELAYTIWKALMKYKEGKESYTVYAEMMGVLETVKLELQRRYIGPYEQKKLEENGDV